MLCLIFLIMSSVFFYRNKYSWSFSQWQHRKQHQIVWLSISLFALGATRSYSSQRITMFMPGFLISFHFLSELSQLRSQLSRQLLVEHKQVAVVGKHPEIYLRSSLTYTKGTSEKSFSTLLFFAVIMIPFFVTGAIFFLFVIGNLARVTWNVEYKNISSKINKLKYSAFNLSHLDCCSKKYWLITVLRARWSH